MAIVAHPDDIESWCAGTLAQAIDQGAVVRLLLVTSGEHESPDKEKQAHEIAAQREGEARNAAEILGLAEVVFLRYPDGMWRIPMRFVLIWWRGFAAGSRTSCLLMI